MIGRKYEETYLRNLLKEEESQFVAILGRRRVGKTYLIRETFGHNFTFQHTGIYLEKDKAEVLLAKQLAKFKESLEESGLTIDHDLANWDEAFKYLKEVVKRSDAPKKVIFIDGLSWMDTPNSGLISALENFYNGFVSNRIEKDVVLIVCASATYWMIEHVVNSKGGLHNRLTGQLLIKPFTLGECEEYMASRGVIMNRHQILQAYMALGGVPYYWSLMKRGLSLAQNMDELFFKDGALLHDEYRKLYASLFNEPHQYVQIIEALCQNRCGLTREEIVNDTHIPSSGLLSRKLVELENCGFIRRYVPFGKKNSPLYQLMDNFTLFHHRFLKDNVYDEHFWENQIDTPKLNAWSGLAFERVCLQHVTQIKAALGISGVYTEVNSWQCDADLERGIFGSQIDLLLVRKDQIINVCEMKYSTDDYVIDGNFDKAMRRKISDLSKKTNTKYAIVPLLLTTYGVVQNSYAYSVGAVITAEQLFA